MVAAMTAVMTTIQSRPRLIIAFRPGRGAQCRVYNNIIISPGGDADVSHNIHRSTVHLLRVVVVVVAEEESTASRGERSYGGSFWEFCL